MVSELQKFVFSGSDKKYIQKGLLRQFFGLKFDLRILDRPERPTPIFGVFSLPAPTLVMTKGLRTFAGPQNAQNNDFFHVHKKRVRFENF